MGWGKTLGYDGKKKLRGSNLRKRTGRFYERVILAAILFVIPPLFVWGWGDPKLAHSFMMKHHMFDPW